MFRRAYYPTISGVSIVSAALAASMLHLIGGTTGGGSRGAGGSGSRVPLASDAPNYRPGTSRALTDAWGMRPSLPDYPHTAKVWTRSTPQRKRGLTTRARKRHVRRRQGRNKRG